MAINVLYIKSDNILEVNGLKNAQSGAYINNASVSATLVDSSGGNVSGETWPITLAYITASNGIYRATVKDSLPLIAGSSYKAKITADGGADLLRYWESSVDAILGS